MNTPKRLFTSIVISASICCNATTVLAKDDVFYSNNDIVFYDPDACAIGTSTNPVAIQGNDNLEKILRFFTQKGLTLAAAAGMAGNFKQESGFNPAIIQGGKIAPEDYNPVNGVGFGLAQWTFTARQKPLVDFVKSRNAKITDLDAQLEFIWKELTTGYKSSTLDKIAGEKDPVKAAYIFHKFYEGSADTEEMVRNGRGKPAQAIHDKFKSDIADGTGVAGSQPADQDIASETPADQCGDILANNGDNSKASYVTKDGFGIYNQYDPRWKDYSIRRNTGVQTTIGRSGCGPSAMAMIINALTGKPVDMTEIAMKTSEKGIMTTNGSLDTIGPLLASEYGLNAEPVKRSVNDVNRAITDKKALIILAGQGSAPFTSGGHFVIIRGVTSTGKWLVGDSNGDKGQQNSEKEWDPQAIIGSVNNTIYAIYK